MRPRVIDLPQEVVDRVTEVAETPLMHGKNVAALHRTRERAVAPMTSLSV
jgi:hypothetical protein